MIERVKRVYRRAKAATEAEWMGLVLAGWLLMGALCVVGVCIVCPGADERAETRTMMDPEELLHEWGRVEPSPPAWNREREQVISEWWRVNWDRYERAWEAGRGASDDWIVHEWSRLVWQDAEKLKEANGGDEGVWAACLWQKCVAMAIHYRGAWRLDAKEARHQLVYMADWESSHAAKGETPPYPGTPGLLDALAAIPSESSDPNADGYDSAIYGGDH